MSQLSQWVTLIDDSAEGVGDALDCNDSARLTVEYEFADDTETGVVKLTHASDPSFAGAWAVLDSKDLAELITAGLTTPGLAVFSSYPAPLGSIRAEITTVFAGGAAPGVVVRVKREPRAFAGRFK